MKLQSLLRFAVVILGTATARGAQQPYPPTTDHPPPAWFVDVALKAGITVRDVNGSVEAKRHIIVAARSGVAILDYDGDGWPGGFLVNGTNSQASRFAGPMERRKVSTLQSQSIASLMLTEGKSRTV